MSELTMVLILAGLGLLYIAITWGGKNENG